MILGDSPPSRVLYYGHMYSTYECVSVDPLRVFKGILNMYSNPHNDYSRIPYK